MRRRPGQFVVAWLERWGERFFQESQSHVYQQFLLHVGATDILRRYRGTPVYWQYVQVILDSFFTSAQRAEMCDELINEPSLKDRDDFRTFLIQAKAEITAQVLIASIERRTKVVAPMRSVS